MKIINEDVTILEDKLARSRLYRIMGQSASSLDYCSFRNYLIGWRISNDLLYNKEYFKATALRGSVI